MVAPLFMFSLLYFLASYFARKNKKDLREESLRSFANSKNYASSDAVGSATSSALGISFITLV